MCEKNFIDTSRPVCIYGSVTRDLSKMTQDPMHDVAMDLAQERLDPDFFNLASPIEETNLEVPAAPLIAWLEGRSRWSDAFFGNLQGLKETSAGEELLTTWMSAELFWSMLADGLDDPAIAAIAEQVHAWRTLGLDEIYFDFYERGSAAEMAMECSAAAPLSA